MIREYLERRRFKRVLAKFIDPESVKAILRGDGEGQKIKAGRIEFVLAFVRGDNPTQISERMARVADVALESRATVYHLVAGLVIAAFDRHSSSPPQPDRRASLVQALRAELADAIKIVHGAANGHYGLFGSETGIFSYSFLVPQFDRVLGALSRLDFGQSEEFGQ